MCWTNKNYIIFLHYIQMSRDGMTHLVQRLATSGRVQRLESRVRGKGLDFLYPSRSALASIQLPIHCVPGLSRGKAGRGLALNTRPLYRRGYRKRTAVPLVPLRAFMASSTVNLPLLYLLHSSVNILQT